MMVPVSRRGAARVRGDVPCLGKGWFAGPTTGMRLVPLTSTPETGQKL